MDDFRGTGQHFALAPPQGGGGLPADGGPAWVPKKKPRRARRRIVSAILWLAFSVTLVIVLLALLWGRQ